MCRNQPTPSNQGDLDYFALGAKNDPLRNSCSITPPSYWLPRHVFVCATQGGAVFLDLKRDKYFGLPDAPARVLAAIVEDWPDQFSSCQEGDLQGTVGQDATRVAEALVEHGLLTHDQPSDKEDAERRCRHKDGIMEIRDVEVQPLLRPRHIIDFMIACIKAKLALRFRSLEAIARDVDVRRRRLAGSSPEYDAQKAAELVNIFRRLRIYAFAAENRCLFHALALLNFLAPYGLFPRWVIGVRANPWGAHSWVQHEHIVLDGTPEQVLPYQPILNV